MSFNDIIVVVIILVICFWAVKQIRKWLVIYIETRRQLNPYDETKNSWARWAIKDTRNRLIGWFLLLAFMIFCLVLFIAVNCP